EHFENIGAFAGSAPLGRAVACGFHRAHVHAVHLVAGNVEGQPAARQIYFRRRARDRGAHGVTIVLDYVDHRQLPEFRHVETLIDLTLVSGAVAKIGNAEVFVSAVTIGEGQPRPERDLRTDNAVAAVEALLHAEHVHGAALASGIPMRAAGE